jgi:microcystin-dependent protein
MDPFLGEIRMVGFSFAPSGWAFCNGQVMQIVQNTALFSLLGTTYGGNGSTTYGLPDLQGRIPIHFGSGPGLTTRNRGQTGGSATATLGSSQLPAHSHTPMGADGYDAAGPDGNTWGTLEGGREPTPAYNNGNPDVTMHSDAVLESGSPSPNPHNNLQPYLAVNFVIATSGLYPARD